MLMHCSRLLRRGAVCALLLVVARLISSSLVLDSIPPMQQYFRVVRGQSSVLDDDVNRIKEGYADPTNAMAFLESLQKHVASGIEEISGMTEKILESKEETKQLAPV